MADLLVKLYAQKSPGASGEVKCYYIYIYIYIYIYTSIYITTTKC